MSEFKEFKNGDRVCLIETSGKCLFEVVEEKAEFTDKYIAIAIISPKGNLVRSSADWIIKKYVRHATPEEIAAGHRIDCEVLDKPENHISPNCKVTEVHINEAYKLNRLG
ncbi:hypothetical protein NRA34_14315 [Acinetobacter baumannii]|nr:hypothetical protein [Acinetobacter baumannii]